MNSKIKFLTSCLLLFSFILAHPTLHAQTANNEIGYNADAANYANTITQYDLMRHLDTLTSPRYGGRETGEYGQKIAAQYIAQHFKNLNCPHVSEQKDYFQRYKLITESWDTTAKNTLTINNQTFTFLKDFYAFSRTAPAFNQKNINNIVFAGYGIETKKYNDYKKINAKNKTLLILNGEPINPTDSSYVITGDKKRKSEWSTNWRTKLMKAKDKGADLVLVVVPNIEQEIKRSQHQISANSMYLKDAAKNSNLANVIYISPQMANLILKAKKTTLEKQQKYINAHLASKTLECKTNISITLKKNIQEVTAENVIGYIEGIDPEVNNETIFITAHYDHLGVHNNQLYAGADDDGSGTVAIMEIAEAFAMAKKDGKAPRRSIVIMAVSGEEKGLLGSQYYTDVAPMFALSNTVCNLNIDMIGRIDDQHQPADSNYVYIIGSNKISTELHQINEQTNQLYTHLNLDYKYNADNEPNRFYYRSDHYNFAKNNIPVIFYFNGTHADYHQHTDTIDKINFAALKKRAQLVFYTAWELANKNNRIKIDEKAKTE